MHVTMQLQIQFEKARRLRERLEQLRKTAYERRAQLQEDCLKDSSPEREVLLAKARATELDINITNLLRALLEAGSKAILSAPDERLLTHLSAVSPKRGRPGRL
jgi:hypothetical protein